MKHINHAPLVINGKTIPVSELGDIKDMSIADSLQAMLDRGYFGEYPPGTPVFSVLEFKYEMSDISDAPRDRYEEVCDLLDVALDLESKGLDSTEARKAYEKALRDHDMISKLERP